MALYVFKFPQGQPIWLQVRVVTRRSCRVTRTLGTMMLGLQAHPWIPCDGMFSMIAKCIVPARKCTSKAGCGVLAGRKVVMLAWWAIGFPPFFIRSAIHRAIHSATDGWK